MPSSVPAFMVQGAGSNVGKSLLVAGLCRVFARRGLIVRPFKPQNMSNNAAVTIEGGEIGRAQALQARACYTVPSIDMNPVLLKPETDTGVQVIVQGKRVGSMNAKEYGRRKAKLLPKVLDSFERLKDGVDLVIVEGAGSPAEVNLREGDIANMGFAEEADLPVVLVGDIDRGGVIASLVGTKAVMEERDSARIKGFLINKFRGDPGLFADGMKTIERKTGWTGLGIIPWFDQARILPAEDILDLGSKADAGGSETAFHVAVPVLKRIANFDDLDPFSADPEIRLTLVEAGDPLPMDADLVLLPGSKSTIADLAFLREQRWDIDLAALLRQGASVVGICGGYQMLGMAVHDPEGLEGKPCSTEGLGLLDVETTLFPEKETRHVEGTAHAIGGGKDGVYPVKGYEIHLGVTSGPDSERPMLIFSDGRPDGAIKSDGRVMGCYMHGLFASDAYRAAWSNASSLEAGGGIFHFDASVEDTLDALADCIGTHAEMGAIGKLVGMETSCR